MIAVGPGARPDALAIAAHDARWTWRELEARVADLARAIAGLGGAEPVALVARPGAHALAAVLGALRAGRIIAPIAPQAPILRSLEATIALGDDAALGATLRAAGWDGTVLDLARLAPARAAPPAATASDPHATALVVFSSGSTGRPKGIALSQASLAAGARGYGAALGLTPADRVAWLAPLAFGAAWTVAFGALAAGATLVQHDPAAGLALVAWLEAEAITALHAVPSLLGALADAGLAPDRLPALRVVKIGGEAPSARDLARLRAALPPRATLVNGLGITEASGNVCYAAWPVADLPARPPLPVGRAPAGTTIAVVDEAGAAVPDGALGRIVVRSDALANGYWRDPAGTAATFAPRPGHGAERWLWTQDLGRLDADGTLTHVGRRDDVVKVRGQAVALSEVEAALRALPGVAAAAVLAHAQQIVAFVVAPDVAAVRAAVAAHLPEVQRPARLVAVPALPRLASGKLDRQALLARLAPDPRASAAPSDALEAQLRAAWERALGVPDVGPDEDFFALGGHSLAAAEIMTFVERHLGARLPLTALVEHPTVAALAGAIRATRARAGHDDGRDPGRAVVLLHAGSPDERPIFMLAGKGVEALRMLPLARQLGPHPVYGLQHAALRGGPLALTRLDAMADELLGHVRRVAPRGPYRLVGASFGGRVVFELARRLRAAGEELELLVLLDCYAPHYLRWRPGLAPAERLRAAAHWLAPERRGAPRSIGDFVSGARTRLRRRLAALELALGRRDGPPERRHLYALVIAEHAARAPDHAPADVALVLMRSAFQPPDAAVTPSRALGWEGRALRGLEVQDIPGGHGDYFKEPVASVVAERLRALLARARARTTWDALAAFWDDHIEDHGSALAARVIVPALERRLGPVAGLRVLDIGCGNGWLARRLARAGASVVAFDVSPALVARARARSGGCAADRTIAYHVADATRPDAVRALAADGPFDVAVALMALMDIDDVDPLFAALAACVRPGGRLVFAALDARAVGLGPDDAPRRLTITALPGQPTPHEVTVRPERWLAAALARAGWRLHATEGLIDETGDASAPPAAWITHPDAPRVLVGEAHLVGRSS